MPTYAYPHILMLTNAYSRLLMLTHAYPCLPMLTYVYSCSETTPMLCSYNRQLLQIELVLFSSTNIGKARKKAKACIQFF